MTRHEVSQLVALLMGAFPRGQANSRVYERMLQDLDHRLGQLAVARLIRTSRFLPTVAEVREAAVVEQNGVCKAGVEAWATVMRAVRRKGAYEAPRWQDERIAKAVQLWGGWEALCRSPENDAPGRARFVELYDALVRRERYEAQAAYGLRAGVERPQLEDGRDVKA